MQNHPKEGCKKHTFQFKNHFCNNEEMRSCKSRLNDYAISRKSLSIFAREVQNSKSNINCFVFRDCSPCFSLKGIIISFEGSILALISFIVSNKHFVTKNPLASFDCIYIFANN